MSGLKYHLLKNCAYRDANVTKRGPTLGALFGAGTIASTISGAVTLAQLEESLKARDLILDEETLRRINEIDEEIPTPMTEDGLRRL